MSAMARDDLRFVFRVGLNGLPCSTKASFHLPYAAARLNSKTPVSPSVFARRSLLPQLPLRHSHSPTGRLQF